MIRFCPLAGLLPLILGNSCTPKQYDVTDREPAAGGQEPAATGGSAGAASEAGGTTHAGGTTGKRSSAAGGSSTTGGTSSTGGSSANGGTPSSGGTSAAGGSSAIPTYCTASSALFCDDFEDGNTTGWSIKSGTWAYLLSGTDGVFHGSVAGLASIDSTATLTDQTVRAVVKAVTLPGSSSSYRMGVVTRATSATVYYSYTIDGAGTLALKRGSSTIGNATGTCSDMSTLANPSVENELMMVVSGVIGSIRIRTYLNGTLEHDCTTTSTSAQASGAAGLLVVGSGTVADFDDVTVTSP